MTTLTSSQADLPNTDNRDKYGAIETSNMEQCRDRDMERYRDSNTSLNSSVLVSDQLPTATTDEQLSSMAKTQLPGYGHPLNYSPNENDPEFIRPLFPNALMDTEDISYV